MKKLLSLGLLLLLISAIVPLGAVLSKEKQMSTASADNTQQTQTEGSTADEMLFVVSDAIQYVDSNTHSVAKRAVLEICRSNYRYLEENNLVSDEISISNYSDELFEELCDIYGELELEFFYEGKRRYIPIISSGNVNTATSDEYPYMASVASPWDAECYGHIKNREYPCGVSVWGINYLCSEGYECADVLGHYLPYFEILKQG